MKRFVVSMLLVVGILFGIPTLGAVASTEESLGCSFVEYLSYTEDIPITVVMEFNYPSLNAAEKYDATSMDADTYIAKIREDNRAYYSVKNQEYIMENRLNELEYSCSSYSPFVFFYYADYQKYLEDKEMFVNLSQTSSSISLISVEEKNHKMECVEINDNPKYYGYGSKVPFPMKEAKEMIEISTDFSGYGIKIGIIDEGNVYYSSNFPAGTIVETTTGPQGSQHTTKVASIIGGRTGIAHNANLYLAPMDGISNDKSVERFIEKGVNIVNMSFGDGREGYYDGTCAYYDRISVLNNITFVTSAGNDWQEKKISNPGMGLNVITVGSVDRDKKLSYFSSYAFENEYGTRLYQPNLVAPGEYITIDNTNNTFKESSGISFSAPMVVGTVALLMEEFPELKTNAGMVFSVLMSGASRLPGQYQFLDRTVGAGLLNYKRSREILLNKATASFDINQTISKGSEVGEFLVTVPANKEAAIFGTHPVVTYAGFSLDKVEFQFTKYKIEIYELNEQEELKNPYLMSIPNNSNTLFATIKNTTNQEKKYVVKMIMDSEYLDSEKTHSLHISYGIHPLYDMDNIHSNNATYQSIGKEYHQAYCSCGSGGAIYPHIFYYVLVRDKFQIIQKEQWECICGEFYKGHNYEYEVNEQIHKGTCECGKTIEESHIPEVLNCHTTKCKDCGYLMVDNSYAHQYKVSKVNEQYHRYDCECGESFMLEHTPSNPSGTHNKGNCTVCGALIVEHSYDTNNCEYYTNDHHKAYCECGVYELRPHVVSKTWVKNGKTYGTCIECKRTIEMGKGLIVPPDLLGLNLNNKENLYIKKEDIY